MLSQRALEAFREVMRCGTFSAAAAEMNVSQPAVSRQIRELEESLGMTLFVRHGGRVIATQEAHELWSEVERNLIGLKQIERAAEQIKRGQRATLAVAAAPVFALTILPEAVKIMQTQGPELSASFLSVTTLPVERQLTIRQCQIGFTVGAKRSFEVDLIRTGALPYWFIGPPGHPMAEADAIALDDLAGQNLVGFEDSTLTGRAFDRMFSRMGTPPVIKFRSYLSHIVSALVLRDLGIGIVDPLTAEIHVQMGGVARPFRCDERFEYSVIKTMGEKLSTESERLAGVFEALLDRHRDV